MNLYKRFTKEVGIVSISEFILKANPIFFLPIITKALGASDYGVYTSLFVTFSLLEPFSELGLRYSVIRLLAPEKNLKRISSIFTSSLFFTFILSLMFMSFLFVFSDDLASTVFGEAGSGEIIRVGSFIFPIIVLNTLLNGFFRMRRRMQLLSAFKILHELAPLILSVIFIIQGHGLLHVIYAFIITRFILVIIKLPIVFKEIGLSRPSFSVLPPFLRFGIPLTAAALAGIVLNVGDRYILGFMLTSTAVGIYAVSYNLGNTLLFLLHPINIAILAPLSQAFDSGKMDQVKNYLNYSVRYFLMFSIPAIVGLTILQKPIIRSLASADFVTIWVTPVITISILFYGLFTIASQVFLLLKKTHWHMMLIASAATANVILNIILIPIMGIVGAALSTLICYLALFLVAFFLTSKHIKLSIDLSFLAKSILSALIMGVFVYFMSPRGWVNISIIATIAAALYFGLMISLKAFRKNELNFFMSFFKKSEEEGLD